jgi:copper oxidase (laccase) domain-containing protein
MTLGSPLLSAIPGLRHAFFSREGGVSEGIYAGLNGGIGSSDDPAHVAENRRRMAARDARPAHAFSQRCIQVHSPDAVVATGPWDSASRAACRRHRHPHRGPCHRRHRGRLRADPVGRSQGACDRRGACRLEGRADGCGRIHRDAMEKLGAERSGIVAAIGPLIRQPSYEVGGEFVERFLEADAENALFFMPAARENHAMFDLAGFIRKRLENAGVLMIDDIGIDTYSDERFFSYRRSVHRKEADYGRHVHAIVLES